MLVIFGTIFQSIVMATFFPWYHPRTIFLVVLSVVSWVYLMPKNLDPQSLLSLIQVHRLSADHVRYIFLASFMIPTWLEARTLGYLSQVLCQAGWGYNFCVTVAIAGVIVYRRSKNPRLSPRQHFYASIYILYGGAFWVSLLHFRIRNIPSTAGPFLLSSGTLLLTWADQGQYTRVLRHALRLTLRDTLATVSGNVQEDEMLQLAMLRWIVDYWSTTSPNTNNSDNPPSRSPASSTATPPTPFVVESGTMVSRNTAQTPSISAATPPTPFTMVSRDTAQTPSISAATRRLTRRQISNTGDIRWNDLLSMLDMTANQMEEEVRHSPNNDQTGSVQNLRHMLASMDIDEHAQPAVDAYKQVVQDFPPSRETALAISVVRRCPASLVLIWRYLLASILAFPSTFTMFPFVALEIHRVLLWAKACHRSVNAEEQETNNRHLSLETITSIPQELDTMSVLLSRDNYSLLGPPTLLQVWFNIQGSVQALEKGLTAARCAHTTVVAAEFADNLMSLAQLGFEVSRKGWVHGLGVLVQELIHLQVGSQEGRYTSAAKSALRNSQTMARNVEVLVEEDAPIIAFLQAIIGRGWLWGHEEHPAVPESTVVITELADDEEDITGEPAQQEATKDASPELVETRSTLRNEVTEELELTANVNERGLISDGEKSAFEELLRSEPETSAVESVKKSLIGPLQEEEGAEEHRALAQDMRKQERSDVLELVFNAHERGLISDVVKVSFEAMLSGVPGKLVLESVKLSILEQEEAQSKEHQTRARNHELTDILESIASVHERGLISETEKRSFAKIMAGEPEQNAIEGVKKALTGILDEEESRAKDELPGTDETRSSIAEKVGPKEPVEVEPDERDTLPAISFASSWEETPLAENFSLDNNLESSCWEASMSQKIEPSNENRLGPELTRRLQLEPDDSEESARSNQTDENDVLKWVGSGLAVIGAVIGTVAMHNSQQEGENQERQPRNQSRGRVVELSSEPDDDGWVSVSDS